MERTALEIWTIHPPANKSIHREDESIPEDAGFAHGYGRHGDGLGFGTRHGDGFGIGCGPWYGRTAGDGRSDSWSELC